MTSNSPTVSEPELVNHSTIDLTDPAYINNSVGEQQEDHITRPPPLTRASTSALDKCWICLSTKDEDPVSPPNPPTVWRTPCRCTLQAHQTCLLDWIADQEAPRTGSGSARGQPDQILCPQCKSEIKIQRPSDPIVQICRRLDRSYSRMILPALGIGFTGTIGSAFWIYGHFAVYAVFGRDHAIQIYRWILSQDQRAFDLAYAFIPFNLVFMRTRFARYVLPSGSLLLLATQLENGLTIQWPPVFPPLPSTVFACLPVVKQCYDDVYDHLFGALNKKWIAEVQPRREEGYEGQEGNIADIMNEHEAELAQQAVNNDNDGGLVLQVELNLGVEDQIPAAGDGEAEGQNAEGQQAAEEQPHRVHRLLGDNELMDDTTSIGQNLVGALALPFVAAGSGELLKMLLPPAWTSSVARSGRPNLLSTKWGRSVIGGCAFVVLKDVLVLYCRWRMASSHKSRRVMNYDKINKEYVKVDD